MWNLQVLDVKILLIFQNIVYDIKKYLIFASSFKRKKTRINP